MSRAVTVGPLAVEVADGSSQRGQRAREQRGLVVGRDDDVDPLDPVDALLV